MACPLKPRYHVINLHYGWHAPLVAYKQATNIAGCQCIRLPHQLTWVLLQTRITEIRPSMCSYIRSFMWDVYTHSLANFNFKSPKFGHWWIIIFHCSMRMHIHIHAPNSTKGINTVVYTKCSQDLLTKLYQDPAWPNWPAVIIVTREQQR